MSRTVSEFSDFSTDSDSQEDDADALGDADVCEELESKAAFGSDNPKVKDDMDAKQLPNLLFVRVDPRPRRTVMEAKQPPNLMFVSMFSEALTIKVEGEFYPHRRLDRRTEKTALKDVFVKAREHAVTPGEPICHVNHFTCWETQMPSLLCLWLLGCKHQVPDYARHEPQPCQSR